MRVMQNLCMKDIKNICREPILFMAVAAPVILIIIINTFLPWLDGYLAAAGSFSLQVYYPVIAAVLFTVSPFIIGVLGGLLVLGEKEENIIVAYAVTPLGKNGYLLYCLLLPGAFCLLMMVITVPFIRIIDLDFLRIFPVLLISSLLAPIISLFMSCFGSNRVEGLTFTKMIGILIFFPVIAYFFNHPITRITCVLPNFWVFKSVLAMTENNGFEYWIGLLLGMMLSLMILKLLYNKFTVSI